MYRNNIKQMTYFFHAKMLILSSQTTYHNKYTFFARKRPQNCFLIITLVLEESHSETKYEGLTGI